MHEPRCAHEGQGTALRIWFSPAPLWDPGTALGSSGPVESPLSAEPSLLDMLLFTLFYRILFCIFQLQVVCILVNSTLSWTNKMFSQPSKCSFFLKKKNWYTLFIPIFQVWKCMLASSNTKVFMKNA